MGSGSCRMTEPQVQQQPSSSSSGVVLRVCPQAELSAKSRRLIRVDGRCIAVYHVKRTGGYYALDNACYHHGLPILNGDIEDLGNGHICVRCPWHSYRIDLVTGEGWYYGVNPPSKKQTLKSKGPKQRPYPVHVDEEGYVCVTYDTSGPEVYESDQYAASSLCNRPDIAGQSCSGGVHSSVEPVAIHNDEEDGGGGGEAEAHVTQVTLANAAGTVGYVTLRLSKAIPSLPGQWLRLRCPAGERTWTIADAHPDGFTKSLLVSQKHGGTASTWILNPADALHVPMPVVSVGGQFTLCHEEQRVFMVSGGIGASPMLAILRGLGPTGNRMTDVLWLEFWHCASEVLDEVYYPPQVGVVSRHTLCTRPTKEIFSAIVTKEDVRGRAIYLCGPEGFMNTVRTILTDTDFGVSEEDIHTETFTLH